MLLNQHTSQVTPIAQLNLSKSGRSVPAARLRADARSLGRVGPAKSVASNYTPLCTGVLYVQSRDRYHAADLQLRFF
jgi:hypothetical protein